MKPMFTLFASVLFCIPIALLGQELDCKVTINTESIASAQRDYLRNFATDVEKYLNETKFTNEDLSGEKIQCSVDIFFKTVSGNNSYLAQVFIGSQRPIYNGNEKTNRVTAVLRIMDASWQFMYTPNQRMIHDDFSFDPFTDFLDFYAYLIIGFDLETYEPMSGSQCFKKALNTVQLAQNSAQGTDWQPSSSAYNRFGIVDELNNIKFAVFRTAFNNYHFDGIDLLAADHLKALNNMLKAIESINDIRHSNPTSVLIKQFFDAKNEEIAESFQSFPDRGVYDILSTCDEEHRRTYQEAKMKQ